MAAAKAASRVRSPWSEPSCTILDPLLEGPAYMDIFEKRLADTIFCNFAARVTGRHKWETWTRFCKLACVNRTWRRALLEWSAIQSWLAIDIPGTNLFSTLRQFGRLRFLSVTDSKLNGELLSALPEFSSTLESVALKGRSEPLDITDALLLRMAHLCKRLRSFVLEGAEDITSIGITALAAACPLTVVSLEGCHGVSAEGVHALCILRPTLHSLSLIAEHDIMDEWMLDMTVVAASVALLAHLQYLNLSGTSCDDDDLNLIAAGCKQLSELSLQDCCHLASASFADAAPSCLQHLACLNLSNCTGLNDDGARALARLSSRPGALLLHTDHSTLHLAGCTSLTSTGLRAFSEGTPKSGQLHLPDVDEDVLACALGMKPMNCASGPHFLFVITSPDLSSCRFTQSGDILISSWGGRASSETSQQSFKLKHEYIHLLPEADRAWHYEPSKPRAQIRS